MAAGKAVSSPRSDSQFRGSANQRGEIGMKKFTTFAFLVADVSVSYRCHGPIHHTA